MKDREMANDAQTMIEGDGPAQDAAAARIDARQAADHRAAMDRLRVHISRQGQPESYLEQETGYLMGLEDARRILNGEPPQHDMSPHVWGQEGGQS